MKLSGWKCDICGKTYIDELKETSQKSLMVDLDFDSGVSRTFNDVCISCRNELLKTVNEFLDHHK